jgi:hypothetical protein
VTDNAAHLNAIGIATPAHEVHGLFASYAPRLIRSERERRLFERMVQRCGIESVGEDQEGEQLAGLPGAVPSLRA